VLAEGESTWGGLDWIFQNTEKKRSVFGKKGLPPQGPHCQEKFCPKGGGTRREKRGGATARGWTTGDGQPSHEKEKQKSDYQRKRNARPDEWAKRARRQDCPPISKGARKKEPGNAESVQTKEPRVECGGLVTKKGHRPVRNLKRGG